MKKVSELTLDEAKIGFADCVLEQERISTMLRAVRARINTLENEAKSTSEPEKDG